MSIFEQIESFVHSLFFEGLVRLNKQTSDVLVFELKLFDDRV